MPFVFWTQCSAGGEFSGLLIRINDNLESFFWGGFRGIGGCGWSSSVRSRR